MSIDYNELKNKMNKIHSTGDGFGLVARKGKMAKADLDILEQFQVEQGVADRMKSKDVFTDAPRSHYDIVAHDPTGPSMRAAAFLKKQLTRLNVPVLAFRYENMNVEKWASGRNNVAEGSASFGVDVLDAQGVKKTFTVPVKFAEGEMKEPEYFLDTRGRKYAFSRDGIEDYVLDKETDEPGIEENQSEEAIYRQQGEEPALAAWKRELMEVLANDLMSSKWPMYEEALVAAKKAGDINKGNQVAEKMVIFLLKGNRQNTITQGDSQALDPWLKKIKAIYPEIDVAGLFEKHKHLASRASYRYNTNMFRQADVNSFKNFIEKYLIESGVTLDEETKAVLANENTNYEQAKELIMQFLGNDATKYVEALEGFVKWAAAKKFSGIVRTADSVDEAIALAVEAGIDADDGINTFASLATAKFGCYREKFKSDFKDQLILAENVPQMKKSASKITHKPLAEKIAAYAAQSLELVKWAEEKSKKEEPKELVINFEGDLVVTDNGGNEVLRFQAEDLTLEDIEALKQEDVEALSKKLEKLQDMGLALINEPESDPAKVGLDTGVISDDDLAGEMPEIEGNELLDEPMGPVEEDGELPALPEEEELPPPPPVEEEDGVLPE